MPEPEPEPGRRSPAYDPLQPGKGEAIAPTGQGGPMDLALDEAESLERPLGDAPTGPGPQEKARSLWSDAWHQLRRNPVFIISSLMILFLVVIAIWPQL